ncbi:MAG: AAA family ATPase [Anaerolineaceae bacterium]|nr:AAA family ATPase [Anaerolineaceae bacterium]
MTALDHNRKTPSIIGYRYLLEDELGRGGMGVVYRAYDRLTGQTVALKRVLPATTDNQPGFSTLKDNVWSSPKYVMHRVAISREFRTLASLRHPYIISVLDYGFEEEEGSPFFTMDYLGNAQNIAEYGSQQPFGIQVNLLMQLLLALTYLHRHGILHRDLKPNNVLVVGGQVKVLDFGLSISLREAVPEKSGTPRYMAPEVIAGKEPTDASDLYGVGMIAYEIFAGHPLEPALTDHWVNGGQKLAELGIDPRVITVVDKLLAPQPENRRINITELVANYTQITQQQLPYQEIVLRDSFLQAAPFIGRDSEIARLTEALDEAIKGKGSTWLLGGVSGVGKSRLLGELQILAQVKNVLVLKGQAVSESNRAYQILREPLRRLVLSTSLSDLEIGILSTIIPDMSVLIRRDVTPAPELDPPQANRERLFRTLASIFRRQTQQIMVVLEDIHWLNEESIDALKYLSERLAETPVMFVASFRQDEKPGLAKAFPLARELTLPAFTSEHIATMTSSIIGNSLKTGDRLVQFLTRQTEGIPLFVVEVIRTLSAQVTDLREITRMPLPEQIQSDGIKVIIQRRLNQIPETDYLLLRVAAVAGRKIDLDVLKSVAPKVDQEKWLVQCSEAKVLDVQENEWRFAHDKLRESILDSLSADEKSGLHYQIAQAIEAVYPEDPGQAVSLSYHWGQAKNEVKEEHYTQIAGEQSLRKNAYQQAIKYLERTLELAEHTHAPSSRLATIVYLLGEAHYASGHMVEGSAHLEKTLYLFDWSKVSLKALTGQVARQSWQRIRLHFIGHSLHPSNYQIQSLVYACRACEKLGQIAYINNEKVSSLYYALRGLNISEQIGSIGTAEQARFYATVSLGAGLVPMHGLARFYLRQADASIDGLKDLDTVAWALEATAVYFVGRGQWEEAEKRLRRCMQIAQEIGSFRRWLEAAAFLTLELRYRCDWSALEILHDQLNAELKDHEDTQGLFWTLLSQSLYLLSKDNRRQLKTFINLSEQRLDELDDPATGLRVQALLCEAKIRLNDGDLISVEKIATRILNDIDHQSATAYPMLDVYVTTARYFLNMWEKYGKSTYHKQARKATKLLNQFAKIFDIGQPAAMIYAGRYSRLAGKTRQAADYAHRGLKLAEQLRMPYYEAEACLELGLQLSATDTMQKTYFDRALISFRRIGANYECNQIENHFSKV